MSSKDAERQMALSLVREMSSSTASTIVLLEACGASLTQERLLLSRAQRLAPSSDPIVRAVNAGQKREAVSR